MPVLGAQEPQGTGHHLLPQMCKLRLTACTQPLGQRSTATPQLGSVPEPSPCPSAGPGTCQGSIQVAWGHRGSSWLGPEDLELELQDGQTCVRARLSLAEGLSWGPFPGSIQTRASSPRKAEARATISALAPGVQTPLR
uniref:Zinc finger protein ZFPM1/2 PR domain-containing protein n=1 Tax=Castor canadensis TaxID=51338 RepID=A0A8C0XF40_CASCN